MLAPGSAGLEQVEVIRSRLASFESSLRTLGALDRQPPWALRDAV